MIYLFTALYCEASLFIKRFHLTKNPENTIFQEFYNEEAGIRLTVTGVGEIAAAAAVSCICSTYRPTINDLLLNVGTCGRYAERGGVFLCNKIIELVTGKTFYPDILYRHTFDEAEIVTGMRLFDRDDGELLERCPKGVLYDMEAAAVYQAGTYFVGPHQMAFLKVVSDNGNAKGMTREQIEQLMEQFSDRLCGFVERIDRVSSSLAENDTGWSDRLEMLFVKMCVDLHCSKVMGDSLRQYIRYFSLSGTDVEAVVTDMYESGRLPCKDKREGKQRFEELKRRLFE